MIDIPIDTYFNYLFCLINVCFKFFLLSIINSGSEGEVLIFTLI